MNHCKHKKAVQLTAKSTLFPMASAIWWWCEECGATRLDFPPPKERKGKWRSPRHVSVIDMIHYTLDGKEWDADTCTVIANIIKNTGRKIREPD
jgi:hypothetical protein